ncbi:MAG: hypothetical protein UR25_C0004G0051 [Candidatus Nomurabacteria bacterium GW2011_GWE1_32_28]|uniref:Uncharacterized protein n=1 Tax=Candidatus Nomurabacteria bacterium GW2011_GWF1_31_48 TaxID=1618767 RepID=A0A0G0BGI6_9BACT|nr:MAG: hypothetical protein UR10_C0004G0050 [Candidatus Nomurabacteria bacterium GW2011_GWF2_30_133]KKP28547.1 MAG: hypothetical protein UR18_C0003G0050 [Candidatus Nomurabacteria bacterium GW2011_GWE2_31_40]KKP30142.1 MAG: hypothetical protein UR19_C0004G0050 [Candidatus Nomurabacteria bacterium GW2011_GWF1_31_48]KKP34687.1 MAG: hypothetical protein UR25_C0004G0051 [Candidatus Nomurabacteria bacterium GW2011_GWE1_32_28]HAS80854.1 hypothetical protein [Candidatus Nomurabacteria bacterium]
MLEKFVLFLHKKHGITPNILSYIRIFSAPFLALFISQILLNKNLTLTIITLILYILIVSTNLVKTIFNNSIPKTKNYDHFHEEILGNLSNKVLIIFLLIPFGLNLFTFFIISAELILVFQDLYSPSNKKQKKYIEKTKIILQILLIPILILQIVTNFVPEMIIYTYIIITIIYTYISVYSNYSHYFYFENK